MCVRVICSSTAWFGLTILSEPVVTDPKLPPTLGSAPYPNLQNGVGDCIVDLDAPISKCPLAPVSLTPVTTESILTIEPDINLLL